MELFKLMPCKYLPDDTMVLISPLSYEETQKCKTVEEVIMLLLKKKKLSVIKNIED